VRLAEIEVDVAEIELDVAEIEVRLARMEVALAEYRGHRGRRRRDARALLVS
jgi:hypothetical protein